MKQIPLTKGLFASVDDADFESISSVKWYAVKHGRAIYAARKAKGVCRNHIYMHVVIAGTPTGMRTDHKDMDGLNNTRSNLRICSASQNQANTRLPSTNTSGLKGAYKIRNKWQSLITVNGRKLCLGIFPTKEEASSAYCVASKKYHGEFFRSPLT